MRFTFRQFRMPSASLLASCFFRPWIASTATTTLFRCRLIRSDRIRFIYYNVRCTNQCKNHRSRAPMQTNTIYCLRLKRHTFLFTFLSKGPIKYTVQRPASSIGSLFLGGKSVRIIYNVWWQLVRPFNSNPGRIFGNFWQFRWCQPKGWRDVNSIELNSITARQSLIMVSLKKRMQRSRALAPPTGRPRFKITENKLSAQMGCRQLFDFEPF